MSHFGLCLAAACALLYVMTSSLHAGAEQGNQTDTTYDIFYTVRVDDNDYTVRALAVPPDSISSIEIDKQKNALMVNLMPNRGNGTVTIELNRLVIDSKDSEDNDKAFQVSIEGMSANILQQDSADDRRVLKVAFPSDAKQVTIIGTYVVPEFSRIFTPVLSCLSAAFVVLTIAIYRKQKSAL